LSEEGRNCSILLMSYIIFYPSFRKSSCPLPSWSQQVSHHSYRLSHDEKENDCCGSCDSCWVSETYLSEKKSSVISNLLFILQNNTMIDPCGPFFLMKDSYDNCASWITDFDSLPVSPFEFFVITRIVRLFLHFIRIFDLKKLRWVMYVGYAMKSLGNLTRVKICKVFSKN
jgi:hypothetical protein